MKVDLERLRRDAEARERGGYYAAAVTTAEVLALLAVVDAARNGVLAWSEGAYSDIDCGSLEAALEPFGPPEAPRPAGVKVFNVGAHVKDMAASRAWEEVDHWNAEQAQAERDLAVKAAVDAAKPEWVRAYAATRENDAALTFAERAKLLDATLADARQNPRDRARDQLADAGVVVQRQFRSDQERIAELEAEYDAATDEARTLDGEVSVLVRALREIRAVKHDGSSGDMRYAQGIAQVALARVECDA